jgi:hypothetical protein
MNFLKWMTRGMPGAEPASQILFKQTNQLEYLHPSSSPLLGRLEIVLRTLDALTSKFREQKDSMRLVSSGSS